MQQNWRKKGQGSVDERLREKKKKERQPLHSGGCRPEMKMEMEMEMEKLLGCWG
jgi:hypothetical protein